MYCRALCEVWAATEQPCGVSGALQPLQMETEAQDDLQWVAKSIAEQSCVLCSHSSRCLPVLSALFACFAIYFNRSLFSFREHPLKAARSPLLLCRMFSKSVTLHLSPKYKIPSPRLEHSVKAGKPQPD